MTHPISLAHLTVIDLAPPRMIRLAADLGYDAVGLRLIRVTPDTPDFDPAALTGFLEVGADLGARQVICAPYDPDLSRLADNLARMAAACRAHGLQAVLEFFPWTPVPDLATLLPPWVAVATAA